MIQYFIYRNGEQSGPFYFQELETKCITRETLIWFEGLAEWQKAGEAEALKPLFKAVPPPIIRTPPIPEVVQQQHYYQPSEEHNSGSKNVLWYIVAIAIVIVGIFAFTSYQNELESKAQYRQLRIQAVMAELGVAHKKLEDAKANLHDITAFKLLRSSSERHSQISQAELLVSRCQSEINTLESEIRNLGGR